MKIIKTAKYIEKTAQYGDDFGYEPYEGEDYNLYEEREVFRDREGQEDDYDDPKPEAGEPINIIQGSDPSRSGIVDEYIENRSMISESPELTTWVRISLDEGREYLDVPVDAPNVDIWWDDEDGSWEVKVEDINDESSTPDFGSDYGERSDDYNDDPSWGV
mgnify:CR=1 FL=1|jgi:hypothetical protein